MSRKRQPHSKFFLLLLTALAAGAIFFAVHSLQSSQATLSSAPETVTVERGVITKSVSGSGTLSTAAEQDLQFGTSGTISSLDVVTGQHVSAGQIIGQLDQSQANVNLQSAQAQLEVAQENLSTALSAQSDASTTTSTPSTEDAASTQSSGASAKMVSQDKQAVSLAEQQSAADAQLARAAGCASTSTKSSQGAGGSGSYHPAVSTYVAYQRPSGPAGSKSSGSAGSKKPGSTSSGSAGSKSSGSTGSKSSGSSSSSGASTQDSSAALCAAYSLLAAADVRAQAAAESALGAAQSPSSSSGSAQNVADTKTTSDSTQSSTPTDGDIAADRASIAADQLAVSAAQTALSDTVLRAPVAGSIVAVNDSVGENVSAGQDATDSSSSSSQSSSGASALGGESSRSTGSSGSSASTSASGVFTFQPDASLTPVVDVAESDIINISVGQPATVTLDALPNVEFAAHVASIAPEPITSTAGATTYAVTLAFNQTDRRMRQGMTASSTIIISRTHDALSVPSTAITGSGASASVEVLNGATETRTPVVLGAVGDSTTQIVTGVSVGQKLALPRVTLSASSTTSATSGLSRSGLGASSFGAGGGGFGGGGFGGGGGASFFGRGG